MLKHALKGEVRFAFLVIVVAGLFAGCDSSDPAPGTDSQILTGTYQFESFMVEPDASRIPAYNLLDTLVVSETRLQLFDGRDFVLAYRYRGGNSYAIFGKFTVTETQVRLESRDVSNEARQFASLLFQDNRFVLERSPLDGRTLHASVHKVVDLSALSSGYSGIPPLAATLRLRLQQER